MADIAMCQHADCEKSKECYRFTATPSQSQSYMEFKNICRSPTFLWFYPVEKNDVGKEYT